GAAQSDAHTVRTAASSAASPRTPRTVSCCPAYDACAPSSAGDDERTASAAPGRGSASAARAPASARASGAGSGVASAAVRIAAAARRAPAGSRGGGSPSAAVTAGATAAAYGASASVPTQNPGGTGNPARASRASVAAFPPTSAASAASARGTRRVIAAPSRAPRWDRRTRVDDGQVIGLPGRRRTVPREPEPLHLPVERPLRESRRGRLLGDAAVALHEPREVLALPLPHPGAEPDGGPR